MRTIPSWVRLAAAAVTIAAVIWRLGAGPFVDGVRAIDGRALLAAATIGLVTTLCCAWRWTIVARGLGDQKTQEALGRTGSMAGAILQVSVPRAEKIEEHGIEIPPSMGMATALNFQVAEEKVATTGDFVLVAAEVNPVIAELRRGGFAVTALHSHMLEESPRLFFLHFWGVDAPERIGGTLRAALSKVHNRP